MLPFLLSQTADLCTQPSVQSIALRCANRSGLHTDLRSCRLGRPIFIVHANLYALHITPRTATPRKFGFLSRYSSAFVAHPTLRYPSQIPHQTSLFACCPFTDILLMAFTYTNLRRTLRRCTWPLVRDTRYACKQTVQFGKVCVLQFYPSLSLRVNIFTQVRPNSTMPSEQHRHVESIGSRRPSCKIIPVNCWQGSCWPSLQA